MLRQLWTWSEDCNFALDCYMLVELIITSDKSSCDSHSILKSMPSVSACHEIALCPCIIPSFIRLACDCNLATFGAVVSQPQNHSSPP
jgi:hypothetical protein